MCLFTAWLTNVVNREICALRNVGFFGTINIFCKQKIFAIFTSRFEWCIFTTKCCESFWELSLIAFRIIEMM